MVLAMTSQQKIKWQKLDHETELILSDEAIARDAKLLETLRKLVRGNILTSNRSQRPKIAPLLFSKYRGNGFPLNGIGSLVVPRWRDLSPWFKVQLGLMVFAEGDFVHFKIGLHDQLLEELVAEGKDIQTYLRDRMGRCLRSRFGRVPFYFFVFEDRDDTGMFEVPPHVHGSIQLLRGELPLTKRGDIRSRFRKMVLQHGLRHAELVRGKELLRDALVAAAGLKNRPDTWKGKSQVTRVWMKAPSNPSFNKPWGTYAFKNVRFKSSSLGDNRLVFSSKFKTEVEQFWRLITRGDEALVPWLALGRTS
jgi:hypothetical protein